MQDWKLPASDLGNVANPLNGSDQLRAKAVVTRLKILDLILASMVDVIVSKGKMKLNLKYVGDSMLCERRWEGELSVKLTVGAVEDHAIVPDLDFDRYVRFANTGTFEDHAIVSVRWSAYLVTTVMDKIFNIFCNIFKSIHTGV